MYLTYEEYQNMGGTVEQSTFIDLEFQARKKIDWYTFNRLKNDTDFSESVKMCTKHIIDEIVEIQNNSNTGENTPIASQSNDGVSISYNTLSASDAIELAEKSISNTINQYLNGEVNQSGRKLLYRGLYPDE